MWLIEDWIALVGGDFWKQIWNKAPSGKVPRFSIPRRVAPDIKAKSN